MAPIRTRDRCHDLYEELCVGIGISIVGLIMPAVPGTAITNAIRDTLRGDYNSGMARAVEAFVTALSIAIAVAIGLAIGGGANPL